MPKKGKKKLSKKKQKQLSKKKYIKQICVKDDKKYDTMYKSYLNFALFNISKLMLEYGDCTWGGIVDPISFEVKQKYWPNTSIEISDMDKSRINAISHSMVTGDPVWDYEYMKSFIKGGKKKSSKKKNMLVKKTII